MATYTYSGDPALSDLDWVRFQIGDTGPTDWTFSNEEILAAIAEYGGKEAAAAALLQMQAIRLARRPDFAIGRFRESYKDAVAALNEKAKELKAAAGGFGFWAGGVSVADKEARAARRDVPKPRFFRGMMEPPSQPEVDVGRED